MAYGAVLCVLMYWIFSQNCVVFSSINGCDKQNALQLKEHRSNFIHCATDFHWLSRSQSNVTWTLTNLTGTVMLNCTCYNNDLRYADCENFNALNLKGVRVHWDGRGRSSLILPNTSRKDFGQTMVSCQEKDSANFTRSSSCLLDIVYYQPLGECRLEILRENWTVVGSCDADKVYSSANIYSTQVFGNQHVTSNTTQSFTVQNSTAFFLKTSDFRDPPSTEEVYFRGKYVFMAPLPTAYFNISFDLQIVPGLERKVTGSFLTIVRPHRPYLSDCGSAFIPENSGNYRSTCRCDIRNMGIPEGRLVWFLMEINTTITLGSYGNRSLPLPVGKITRSHNGKTLACKVDWAENSAAAMLSFPLRVAYGPDDVRIDYQRPFIANGTNVMTLYCTGLGVYPEDVQSFEWGGLCENKTTAVCKLNPGSTDDGQEVTCTVFNIINSGHNVTSRISLDLKYRPTSAPMISGYSQQPLYLGDRLVLKCAVTGGKPSVDLVSMSCPGMTDPGSNVTAVGSELNMAFVLQPTDQGHICVCSARWQEEGLYTLTSSVVLNVLNGTRPVQASIENARAEGIGIGVAIMILVFGLTALVLFIVWRKEKLACFTACMSVYDELVGKKSENEAARTYTDLSVYEPVSQPPMADGHSMEFHLEGNYSNVPASASETFYENAGFTASDRT